MNVQNYANDIEPEMNTHLERCFGKASKNQPPKRGGSDTNRHAAPLIFIGAMTKVQRQRSEVVTRRGGS